MISIADDLRAGLRLLGRDKAFTTTAGLTLAVCIAANAALFSVVRGVLLEPLPLPEPDRIVLAGNAYPGAGVPEPIGVAVPDYFDRLRDVTAFAEQALFRRANRSVDQSGTPVRIETLSVTPSFFKVAAVEPQLGRTLVDQDGEIGNQLTVVLSDGFWRSHFGGDIAAVGRELRLDGRPHTVVGVMPPGFRPTDDEMALWTPMTFTPEEKSDERRHSNSAIYIARLKPGVTVQQAQAQIDALNAGNLERFPQLKEVIVNAGFRTVVRPLQEQMVSDVRPTLYLMWAGALCVLLIGCVNVVNLVLVRSRVRLKELATRLALGAGTWRIGRQLVVEHLILTIGAALCGIAIAYGALQAMEGIEVFGLPRAHEIRVDGMVMAYTLAAAAATGAVLGVIPAAGAVSANLLSLLRDEGRTGTSGPRSRVLRRGLVIAQVAGAFVLLMGAGLLFASFRKALAVDPGFTTRNVLTAAVSLPDAGYPDDDAVRRFTDEALGRLRTLPGVTAAGATDGLPMGNSGSASAILAEGYVARPGESLIAPSEVRASEGYFEALGVKLAAGRFFTERDRAGTPRVIMVDTRLARRFWPDADPVGRRMYRPNDGPEGLTAITPKTEFLTVVGVVAEMKLRNLTDGDNLVGAYFLPLAQDPQDDLTFVIKADGDPAALSGALRREMADVDPQLPVFDMQPMGYWLERSLAGRRAPALLSIAFGFVALFLSAVGIYAVLAYLVTQRTREIGIRMALGSSAPTVFRLVLGEGVLLVSAGLILGGVGAFFVRRTLESQLFGVTALDPFVLLAVTTILALVALMACAVPARRATRIDPLTALAE